ncbi:hypothetical protein EW145_g2120 [Phellinidium pouzarii]|uniref:Sodium/calcium exchanger membrane region domain-containing protein n=1 Tax=Phellinidium pouzarii TaxID=167371 RepID=A0A4S4LC21_9AGAM|nr:hypothetical protein EW145_g2120 [Phellinidium pouzarii]
MSSLIAQDILAQLCNHPRSAAAASLGALLVPLAVRNYRQYKSLGRNGFPSIFGWVLATLVKPIGRETTSTREYARDANKDKWLTAGDGPREIPGRGRPEAESRMAFLAASPGGTMLGAEFRAIATANADIVEVQVSPHERLGDALMIHKSIASPHAVAVAALREIAHYHKLKDFSLHVVLSPQDCKLGLGRATPDKRTHLLAEGVPHDLRPGEKHPLHHLSPGPLQSSDSVTAVVQSHSATNATNSSVFPKPWDKNSKGSLKRTFRYIMKRNLTSERPVGEAPGFWQGLKAILFGSWLNVLLICIPISWAFHWSGSVGDVLVFVFSFLAIIPLAKLLALATDELSMRVGQTLAGLLNATLGNAVELIVAIIAIIKCELQVVQSSLIGSILSNLLLVLGMCFFAGGTRFQEQGFGASASQINSSLLTLSVIAVLLPAAFHFALQPIDGNDPLTDGQESEDIKMLSHGVAIILLFIYGSYLVFQLWSHANLYDDNSESNFKSTRYAPGDEASAFNRLKKKLHRRTTGANAESGEDVQANGDAVNGDPAHAPADGAEAEAAKVEEEEEEKPSMSLTMCIGLLIVVTVFVAITAEFLVDSIDGVTSSGPLKKEWVGLILLPIVGNAAEHVTAVTVSVKDKLSLSIGVAVGSSIQIALFVIPLMIIIAWGLGKPLLLLFDPFESVTMFLAVLTVNYVVADGKSNWLEGMILMCLYVIIGVSFWFYPGRCISFLGAPRFCKSYQDLVLTYCLLLS